ncbi:MAG: hypothetical protein Q8882_06780 [Bacillota bacterium]|nr:hypothetical protein [Bacillota bacterium]
MDKHYFAAANTKDGFVSKFREIIRPEEAERIIYIKGGSGTGKSTFMKKLARKIKDESGSVEYCHCSSDPASLDGIYDIARNIAVLDATAPHTMDPVYPGAVDMIINFGTYWNEKVLKDKKNEIIALTKEKKNYFDRGYACLKAAGILYGDDNPDTDLANIVAEDIILTYCINIPLPSQGRARYLFASGISSEGVTDYLDTLMEETVVGISDSAESPIILKKIVDAAIEAGHKVDVYLCPFTPDKIEHISIPLLDLSFTTLNKYHSYPELYSLYEFDKVQRNSEASFLIDKATEEFKKASTTHKEIEAIYIPTMDFESLDVELKRIWGLIKSSD